MALSGNAPYFSNFTLSNARRFYLSSGECYHSMSHCVRFQTKLENARKEVKEYKILENQEIKTFCADVTDYNQLSNVLSEVGVHCLLRL
jgi:hypothetical protein